MSLRQKIMLGVILLVFIPVLLMAGATYRLFSSVIERQTERFYATSLLETDRKIQYALGEMNGVSDLSITQPVLQQLLKRPFVGPEQLAEGSAGRQLITELNNLLMSHPKITSLSLYNKQQLVYSSGSVPPIPFESLTEQEWYKKVLKLKGRPLWLGPYEYKNQADEQFLTQVRIIKDFHSLEDIGTLMLTVKADAVDHILWEAGTLNEGEVLVVNQTGTVIFSKSGRHQGEHMSYPFLKEGEERRESYTAVYEGERSFITYLSSSQPGWYMVALTPLEKMRAETVSVRNLLLGLLILTILSVVLFDIFFIRKLVLSIIRVVKAMRRAEAGSFTEISYKQGFEKDESGLLIRGFNRMSAQIQDLLRKVQVEQERKKQAELQALVAQINPHFIYNSLETINSMAVLQGNKEISRIVISLGKLLRISISETQELIPFSTELEHVRHYLFIQTCRFGNKLQYEMEIPEPYRKCLSLKLMVQPIVENALYHGIEPMQGTGVIRITVLAIGEDLVVEVADNGLGMDSARLQELFAAEESEGGTASKTKHRGVGLKNVHDRLRIRFGARYGIMVCSAERGGTIVRMRLPRMERDSRGWTRGGGFHE